ncbi:DUF4145 domain-containing protein [Promicromonospora vindobonensis]|uniref:DUF4145 domain-containing protein n=1 Tax=Promicromonospora vindobonensis TaxID=195748 RepID=A0ABW5W1M5_9MICO
MTSTVCGWCGVHSNMTPHGPEVVDNAIAVDYQRVNAAFVCDYCRHLCVGSWMRNVDFERSGSWPEDSRIKWSPPHSERHTFPDVPKPIGAAATEAWLCFSEGALRGALAVARAVIEASAKHEGVTVKGIATKIEKLAELGKIRPHIKEVAHEIREYGNEIAHGDLDAEYTQEDTRLVLVLMNEVLDDLFQSPARLEQARAARQGRKAKDAPLS